MEQIQKILTKHKNIPIKKISSCKNHFDLMKKELSQYDISMELNDDFSYFKNEVIYQSYLNKKAFEDAYESLRIELYDMWDHMDYTNKKEFIEKRLSSVKENTKYFMHEDKIIRNAFFDTLLNALYENEMIIFEKPQYFRLEKHFKERMISVEQYKNKPYMNDFSSCMYVYGEENDFFLFSYDTKKLYRHHNNVTNEYYLNPQLDNSEFTFILLEAIASAIQSDNAFITIEALLISNLCSENVVKKLLKYQKKVKV